MNMMGFIAIWAGVSTAMALVALVEMFSLRRHIRLLEVLHSGERRVHIHRVK